MKRLFDIVISALLLVILSPVLLTTSILVRVKLGRPVFFRQERPGLHGNSFLMVKFRTMKEARSADGLPLPDADRLTDFGKQLRSTSLDELPGLWNVLKGDMSLVGPRPLLLEYVPLYTTEQYRRMDAKPGITGWAQVNGRNAVGWERKFVLDVWYVDNQSFWLDLKVLLMTAKKVVRRDGIAQDGEATAAKFTGSRDLSAK